MKHFGKLLIVILLIVVLAAPSWLFVACEEEPQGPKYTTIELEAKPSQEVDLSNYGKFISDGEADISIGVLADIHVMSEAQAVDMTCDDFKAWEAHGQKMLGLSESILKTAVDRIIAESDFDVVLVSGDNADDGGEVTHRAVAAELKRLEDAGIKVFTIPGNHDINNKSYTYAGSVASLTNPTTEKEFAEIYGAFGYNATDTLEFYKNVGTDSALNNADFQIGDNLSYVADLSDKYRLIAIDMCNIVSDYYLTDEQKNPVLVNGEMYPLVSGRHDGAMTKELLDWAKAKTKEAIAEGKIPLGMMHFPLTQHFGSVIDAENSVVNDPPETSVASVLANAGMKFIFTGHIHIQDDAIYTTKSKNKILDINSASLCNYPTPIRCFRAIGEEAYIRTWNMNSIAEEYLPSYLTAEEKAAIKEDFREYSIAYLDDSMLAKIKNKIDKDLLYKGLSKIGIKKDGSNDRAIDALVDDLYENVILKFLKLSLYEKDAAGGLSVERAAKDYGVVIPESDYTDVFNLAMSFVAGMYGGDEYCEVGSLEFVLLKYSIYTAFRVIADSGIFAKVRAINPSFAVIDLAGMLPELYREEFLEVCKSNLLGGVVGALDIKKLRETLKVKEDGTVDPALALAGVKLLAFTYKGDLCGFDFGEYIEYDAETKRGGIRIGALLDDAVESLLTIGLTNDRLEEKSTFSYGKGSIDSAPGDNNLKINMTTMAYSALK